LKIYKKKQRAEFFMLYKCPYYETCEAEIRHALGNNERYCLGSINWEYCSQFNKFELNDNSEGRNSELKHIAQEIHKDLQQKFQYSTLFALISFRGEALYRDQGWTFEKLDLIQNLTRLLIPYMNSNEYYILKNSENFLFLKIHDSILLVGAASKNVENLLKGVQENLTKYQAMLETYLTMHPLEK
jgi:transcription termination factor NusB